MHQGFELNILQKSEREIATKSKIYILVGRMKLPEVLRVTFLHLPKWKEPPLPHLKYFS